jgi:hypothetical protein
MMHSISVTGLVAIAVSVSSVSAMPQFQPGFQAQQAAAPAAFNFDSSFKIPGPEDVRSPCPGLNTLANHGFM